MHPFTQFFPTNSIEGHQLRGWSLSQRSWGVGWGVVSLQQGQHRDSRVFWAEVVSFSNGICSESQLFLCYLMFSYLVLLHFVYNAFWPLFVKGTTLLSYLPSHCGEKHKTFWLATLVTTTPLYSILLWSKQFKIRILRGAFCSRNNFLSMRYWLYLTVL